MNAAPDLALRDIHLPAPVSWWPPAPGWWMLAGIILIAVLAGYVWWRRRRARGHEPAALARREFEQIAARTPPDDAAAELVAALSVWLRRSAMTLASRDAAGGLTGERWRGFLNELAGEEIFAECDLALLADAPYRAPEDGAVAQDDARRMLELCRHWLGDVTNRPAERSG